MKQCGRCGCTFEGRFCPRCGAENQPVVRVCPVCGTPFTGNFCPRGCNSAVPNFSQNQGLKGWHIGVIIGAVALSFLLETVFGFVALHFIEKAADEYGEPWRSSYEEQAAATIYVYEEIERGDCIITLERVELTEEKTTAYVTFKNLSGETLFFLRSDSELTQEHRHYHSDGDDSVIRMIDFDESVETTIVFDPIEQDEDFTVALTCAFQTEKPFTVAFDVEVDESERWIAPPDQK